MGITGFYCFIQYVATHQSIREMHVSFLLPLSASTVGTHPHPYPYTHTHKKSDDEILVTAEMRSAMISLLWVNMLREQQNMRRRTSGIKPSVHLVDVRLFGCHCLWGHADGGSEGERRKKRQEVREK